MSWQYFLIPVPAGAVFTNEAMEEMNRWWDQHPIFRRPRGSISLCRDVEYRDYVLRMNATDQADANLEGISIAPAEITFDIMGWSDRIDVISDFMKFCQSKWPCELFEQTKRQRMTPEEYRVRMHKTFDYPSSREP